METKMCRKCKETKPVDMYSKNKSAVDGLQRNCKSCVRAAGIKSYNKDKRAYHARGKQYTKMLFDELNAYKTSQTCKKCGNDKYYLLEFHHIDPSTKDSDVSTLLRTKSKQAAWDEIAKCVVLCKNCHYDFHYQERTHGTTIDIYLS
jgi:hypothetical protein